ncbi:MAG: type II toxin-antitoxin system Phd/YefM family antitoxin [Pseudomonadota bacterium]
MAKRAPDHAVSATEVKNRFGVYLDAARDRPVKISRNGRMVAVLLSAQDYKRLQASDDYVLGAAAMKAHKEAEYMSHEETMRFLFGILARQEGGDERSAEKLATAVGKRRAKVPGRLPVRRRKSTHGKAAVAHLRSASP